LFRDYLRCHLEDCKQYSKLKYQLAEEFRDSRAGYVDAKKPFLWGIIMKADDWSKRTG
jgi:GrpB-like predicted nucleotidyltransferase (UPF0157 family)